MAGIKISNLPELRDLSDDDLFPVVQAHSNTTKHIKKKYLNMGQFNMGNPTHGDYSGYTHLDPNDTGADAIQKFNWALAQAMSGSHIQNTDIGTTNNSFVIHISGSTAIQLREELGALLVRTYNNSGYADVTASNILGNSISAPIGTFDFITVKDLYTTNFSKFGDSLSDNHQFTGSVNITGSLLTTQFSTSDLAATQIAYGNQYGMLVGSPNVTYDGTDVTINGGLQASYKSFKIPHPTQPDKTLIYGSLEGPEHGVYIRGVSKSEILYLPEYWTKLVDENTITVQLTPIGGFQRIYVEKIENNAVYLKQTVSSKLYGMITKTPFNYFYTINGERKDISKLKSEL